MSRLFKRHKHANSPHKTSNSNDDNFLQRLPKSAQALAIVTILLATTGLSTAGVVQVTDQINAGLKEEGGQLQAQNRANRAGLEPADDSWSETSHNESSKVANNQSSDTSKSESLGDEKISESFQKLDQPNVDTIVNDDGTVEHIYTYDDGQAKVDVSVRTGGSGGADLDVNTQTKIKIKGESSISVQFDGDDYQDEGRNPRYNR